MHAQGTPAASPRATTAAAMAMTPATLTARALEVTATAISQAGPVSAAQWPAPWQRRRGELPDASRTEAGLPATLPQCEGAEEPVRCRGGTKTTTTMMMRMGRRGGGRRRKILPRNTACQGCRLRRPLPPTHPRSPPRRPHRQLSCMRCPARALQAAGLAPLCHFKDRGTGRRQVARRGRGESVEVALLLLPLATGVQARGLHRGTQWPSHAQRARRDGEARPGVPAAPLSQPQAASSTGCR